MKVKNKKIAIGLIFSLLMLSSISVIFPIISHYTESNSKNSILLSTANKYGKESITNNNIKEGTNSLINNLSFVQEYISTTVLQKQEILELSIIGSHRDKTDVSNKQYKESQIAFWNRKSLINKKRYSQQVKATINNSKVSLIAEDKVLNKIISIIKEHPYTYSSYLNKDKLVIPDINFFINNGNSLSTNNLDSKTSNISNDTYSIDNNTSFNGVALSSEEQVVNAKAITAAGSSLSKVWFHQISFKAKILTFDTTTNNYKYAKATSIDVSDNAISRPLLNNNWVNANNSQITKYNALSLNNLRYFVSSRDNLAISNSLANGVPSSRIIPLPIIINPCLPSYFNTHLGVLARVTIKYNSINDYKHNKLWFDSTGGLVAGIFVVAITSIIRYKVVSKRKLKKFVLESQSTRSQISDESDTIEQQIGVYSLSNNAREYKQNNATKIEELARIKTRINTEKLTKKDKVFLNDKIDSVANRARTLSDRITNNQESFDLFVSLVDELQVTIRTLDDKQTLDELNTSVNKIRDSIHELKNKAANIAMEKDDQNQLNGMFLQAQGLFTRKIQEATARINGDISLQTTNYNAALNRLAEIKTDLITKMRNPDTVEKVNKIQRDMGVIISQFEILHMSKQMTAEQKTDLTSKYDEFISDYAQQITDIRLNLSIQDRITSNQTKQLSDEPTVQPQEQLYLDNSRVLKRRNSLPGDSRINKSAKRRNSFHDDSELKITIPEVVRINKSRGGTTNMANVPDSSSGSTSITQEMAIRKIQNDNFYRNRNWVDSEVEGIIKMIDDLTNVTTVQELKEKADIIRARGHELNEFSKKEINFLPRDFIGNKQKILGANFYFKTKYNSIKTQLEEAKATEKLQTSVSDNSSKNDVVKVMSEADKRDQAQIYIDRFNNLDEEYRLLETGRLTAPNRSAKQKIDESMGKIINSKNIATAKLKELELSSEEPENDALISAIKVITDLDFLSS